MASRDTKLNIIVDAQNKASRGLSDAKNSLDRMNVSVESISSSLRTMGKYGAVAFAALSAASGKLINDAASSLQIEESYRRMTEQAGISSDELLKQLKKTSVGTVSSTNLMLSANRAMALGVADNMDTVTSLMEIARLKGRALGLDTTQAFNDIVTGIGRGSPLILDNLGITIKLGEAQEMYAAKLGKTSAELTDAERKQALLNAVLTEGNKEVAAAGELQVSAAEKLQAMKAQLFDTADTIGRTLIPAATKFLEAILPIIEKVAHWVEENPKLTATIIGISLAATALLTVLGGIGLMLPGLIIVFGALSGTVGVVIGIIGALGFAISQVIGIAKVLSSSWSEVWTGIQLTAASGANAVISMVEGMINYMIEKVNSFINQLNKVIKLANKVKGVDIGTIGTLESVSLNKINMNDIVDNASFHKASLNGNQQVVVTGNTFLSEDAAEQMGDLVMNRLKLSNAI